MDGEYRAGFEATIALIDREIEQAENEGDYEWLEDKQNGLEWLRERLDELLGDIKKNESEAEYRIKADLKSRLEKYLYRELENDTTSVEINELLDGLEKLSK